MKKSFFILGTLIIFSYIFAFDADAWDYPIVADVEWIEFNHNSSNNSLDICKNNSTDVLKSEWKPSAGNRNEPIAYIKGQSNRRVKAAFIITQGGDDIYSLYINAAATSAFGNLVYNWVTISNGQGSDYFQTTSSWSVPGTVGIRTFLLYWEIVGVNGEIFDDMYQPILFETTGWHTYYTVLNTPQSPMSEPWTEVLDYACDWASGKSSISSALEDLTEELYDCGAEYDGYTHFTSGYTNLNLTDLLDELENPGDPEMDCRDFSNFLQVLLNSLGGSCQYKRIDRTSYPYYFQYNYLYPAGWSSKADPGYWNYHQVGWENSKVADASTKLDFDPDPTSSPHDWELAVGDVSLSTYIDKLTETPDVAGVATGTCTVY